MATTLLPAFIAHIEAQRMMPVGSRYLIAVSGGRDSMALAMLCLQSSIKFSIAHCNFGLRGTESDADEALVRNWCEQNAIICHCIKFDTKAKSELWKKGTQETARKLRYDWFEELRVIHEYKGVLTAHHANDNAETLLMNLCRGTGIAGLHGIKPVNGHLIRPLLFASRDQISDFVVQNNVPYRDDASNAEDDYLRNAIRHRIVPAMQELFPIAVQSINETIERIADAEQLYNKAINAERKQLLEQRGKDFYIPIRKLKNRQPLKTIVYELLAPFGFSSGQVSHILSLCQAESGHFVQSVTHRIIRNRDFLVITANQPEAADIVLIETLPCTIDTGDTVYRFSKGSKPAKIPADKLQAHLDMKEIHFPLVLRKWKTGDYFYPFGMKMKKKKVSRLLIDEKVPLHEKESLRILEASKRVAWVAGIRPDERFRVTEHTQDVLIVVMEKKL